MQFTQKHKNELLIALDWHIYWDTDLSEKQNLFANRWIYNLIAKVNETDFENIRDIRLNEKQRDVLIKALEWWINEDADFNDQDNKILCEMIDFFSIWTKHIERIIKENLLTLIWENRVNESVVTSHRGGAYINIAREFKDGIAWTVGLPTFISGNKIEKFLDTQELTFLY